MDARKDTSEEPLKFEQDLPDLGGKACGDGRRVKRGGLARDRGRGLGVENVPKKEDEDRRPGQARQGVVGDEVGCQRGRGWSGSSRRVSTTASIDTSSRPDGAPFFWPTLRRSALALMLAVSVLLFDAIVLQSKMVVRRERRGVSASPVNHNPLPSLMLGSTSSTASALLIRRRTSCLACKRSRRQLGSSPPPAAGPVRTFNREDVAFPFCAPVPGRSVLRITGRDASRFLNGLAAVRIPETLETGLSPLYAAFLHAQVSAREPSRLMGG